MIKEAAKELQVEAYVLRFWEDELGLEIKRNSMGHRYYDEKDLRMFKEVKTLKSQGFALKEIRVAIDKFKNENGKNQENDRNTEQNNGMENEGNTTSNIKQDSNETESRPNDSGDRTENADLKVVDFKQAQMQTIMNKIVANALRENKDIITTSIKSEITADVMRQFDTVMREKEEREEERYRKLDTILRELQQANREIAATKVKKGLFRKK